MVYILLDYRTEASVRASVRVCEKAKLYLPCYVCIITRTLPAGLILSKGGMSRVAEAVYFVLFIFLLIQLFLQRLHRVFSLPMIQ